MIPFPKLIEDDANCKPNKSYSESAIGARGHQIMSKLKQVLGNLDPIVPKINNEEIKKMQKRTAFVLSEEMMKKITEAKDVLCDPDKKTV